MSEVLLELKDISYAYEGQPHALKSVSLRVNKGEKIAVVGRNGAGKSTFFLCCNGVLEPQHGQIIYNGKEITHSKKDLLTLRKQVGIVFQDPNQQIIGSTVESEISFGPMNMRMDTHEIEACVEEALQAMNLVPLRERPPHYLSGGEKKRLSIADILAMHPELILFDEPTASLDVANIEVLEKTLDTLHNEGKTLIVSTHDIDFVYKWATRVLVFHKGELVEDSSPQEVFADSALMAKTGLPAPMIYRFARLLMNKGLLAAGTDLPRNFSQLEDCIATNKL